MKKLKKLLGLVVFVVGIGGIASVYALTCDMDDNVKKHCPQPTGSYVQTCSSCQITFKDIQGWGIGANLKDECTITAKCRLISGGKGISGSEKESSFVYFPENHDGSWQNVPELSNCDGTLKESC